MQIIKNYLMNKMDGAFLDSEIFLKKLLEDYCNGKKNLKILDMGCGDGKKTKYFTSGLKNVEVYGIDLLPDFKHKYIKYTQAEIENKKLPYKDNFFDIVYSNQVIEHFLDKDLFLSESYRILKKGGLCITATENIASFDNILSLILGQEPLVQHTGTTSFTNSFLSPHFKEQYGIYHTFVKTNKFGHKNVCSYYGLKRLVELAGFSQVKVTSFGHLFKLFEILLPIQNRVIVTHAYK